MYGCNLSIIKSNQGAQTKKACGDKKEFSVQT